MTSTDTPQPAAEGVHSDGKESPCTCLHGPEDDAGTLLHASYCATVSGVQR